MMIKKARFKPLLPTLKEKKRYVLYRVYCDVALPANAGHVLLCELNSLLGVFGAARAGLQHITFDASSGRGVFRVSNSSVREVRACLLLVTSMRQQEVMVRPLRMSGILHKVKEEVVVR